MFPYFNKNSLTYNFKMEDWASSQYSSRQVGTMENSPQKSILSVTKDEEKDYKLKIHAAEIEELKHSLRFVEIQLAKAHNHNKALSQNIAKLEQENEKIRSEYAQSQQIIHTKAQQLKEMQLKLDDATALQFDIKEKTQVKLEKNAQEIKTKENEIRLQKDFLKEREEEIKKHMREHEVQVQQTEKLEDELDHKNKELNSLETRLLESEKAADALRTFKFDEKGQTLELEHLRADNLRLLRLLKTTNEFKNFDTAQTWSKSRFGQAVPHKTKPALGRNSLGRRESPSKLNKQSKFAEKENVKASRNWIPTEAYSIANDFRVKYQGQLNETNINRLLAELNQIWRDREVRIVDQIRNNTNAEVMSLRRQMAMRIPYDEEECINQVKGLKQELRQAHSEVTAKGQHIRGKHEGLETAKLKLEEGNWEDQGDRMNSSDFVEGAAWLGKKAMEVAENVETKVKNLKTELEQVKKSGKVNPEEWLLEKTDQITKEYAEGVQTHIVHYEKELAS